MFLIISSLKLIVPTPPAIKCFFLLFRNVFKKGTQDRQDEKTIEFSFSITRLGFPGQPLFDKTPGSLGQLSELLNIPSPSISLSQALPIPSLSRSD